MNTLLNRHKHDLYSDLEKIKDGLNDTTLGIKHLIGNSYLHSLENVKETSENYKEITTDYIANNPYKAMGISVITGFFIGLFLRRINK